MLMAGPLVYCFENFSTNPYYIKLSILIIIYIVISDILDGYFARISSCVTDFGKIIDPLADKSCFLVVLIFLIDKDYMIFSSFNIFLFFYVMLFVRDMILVTISLFNIINKNHVPQANLAGKLFIFFSSIMIILFIYEINTTIAYVFYVLSVIMMISSTFTYFSELKKVRSL